MKDKEAREELAGLRQSLGGISVKDCPVCRHPVLMKGSFEKIGRLLEVVHQCLTCGSKFGGESKDVCEIIE